jgi:hypothetical protein
MSIQVDNQKLIQVGEDILRLAKDRDPSITYDGIEKDLQELAQVTALLHAGVLIPDSLMPAYNRLYRVLFSDAVLLELPLPFSPRTRENLCMIVNEILERDPEMQRVPVEAYTGLRSLSASLESWGSGNLQIEHIALLPLTALLESIADTFGEGAEGGEE